MRKKRAPNSLPPLPTNFEPVEFKSITSRDKVEDAITSEEGHVQSIDKKELKYKQGNASMRRQLVPIPKLEGSDAIEQYVDTKAVALLPEAIAEVEYQLKFGDDKQRIEAAHDVLDMNGRRRRDPLAGGANTLILNMAPGSVFPWEAAKEVVQRPSTVLANFPQSGLRELKELKEVPSSVTNELPVKAVESTNTNNADNTNNSNGGT